MRRCSGTRWPRQTFSPALIARIKAQLPSVRQDFDREMVKRFGRNGDLENGYRFSDDQAAIARIESATTEEEFLKDVRGWLWDALEDCAKADYWYTYEKDWG